MEDLLARLKTPHVSGSPTTSESTRDNVANLHQPQPQSTASASSLLVSQPLSPNPSEKVPSDRAANLLNLLKFNSNVPLKPATSGSSGEVASGDSAVKPTLSQSHSRNESGSSQQNQNINNGIGSPTTRSLEHPQTSLLNLLNRVQTTPTSSGLDTTHRHNNINVPTPNHELKGIAEPVASQDAESKSSLFTYVSPFDQLAASSPLNQVSNPDVLPENGISSSSQVNNLKKSEDTTNSVALRSQGVISPEPPRLPDGRTRVEAIMGIGAPGKTATSESVTEALGEVSEKVNKEAQDAIAKAEANAAVAPALSLLKTKSKPDAIPGIPTPSTSSTKMAVPSHGKQVTEQVELQKNGDRLSREKVDEGSEGATTEVHNFPMRPFVSISIKDSPPSSNAIRKNIVMKIASLKKEFDQVDRSLVTATTNFIVYSLVKGGGIRAIRQDDGNNQQVFRQHGQHMFNLSIRASSKGDDAEIILATAVNGSVYCTTAPALSEDFEAHDLEKNGFVFPPLPSSDENTSGGQLKTRAKQSSRHPDIFAIGRGKSIHIAQVSIAGSEPYINEQSRIVNSEKYLADRSLKIATGKAGKDFTFSDDDTVIVSLDKAGRLKFWDIRNHLEAARLAPVGRSVSVEVKIPTMVLETSAPTEKSWATSVQFIDKEKPFLKGAAIRYLLVGLKQNHTLQLWDLCLGKPVQELNLPHANETDAICSIGYHAKSGVIAIGHPTRNSIYLVHLSAPRYILPTMSQAEFTRRLVGDDPRSLPVPESTAIMSGIRELSLSDMGQLRSLELLHPAVANENGTDKNEETIFEIYIMHSKGVGCLSIKRRDLGWDKDGKVMAPIDGEESGYITVKPLQAIGQLPDNQEQNEQDSPVPSKSTRPDVSTLPLRSVTQPLATANATAAAIETQELRKDSSVSSNDPNSDKKKKRKSAEPVKSLEAPKEVPLETYAAATQRGMASSSNKDISSTSSRLPVDTKSTLTPIKEQPKVQKAASPISGEVKEAGFASALGETLSSAIGTTLSTVFADVLADQMQALYERLDKARRVQDATAAANQDAMLRLVSNTLTDNVEKNLSRIVNNSIKDSVLPALTKTTATVLDQKVSSALSSQLSSTIPREMQAILPGTITKAIREPELQRNISESVTNKITSHIEKEFAFSLKQTISPAFQDLAVKTAKQMTVEIEENTRQQLQGIEIKSNTDSAKIDSLVDLVGQMSSTIQAMAAAQIDLRNEFTKLQTEVASLRATNVSATQAVESDSMTTDIKDGETDNIAHLISTGRYEEGTIQWLSSARKEELWSLVFVNVDPSYLQHVNQIVTLSVVPTVSAGFDTDIAQRVSWLEAAIACIDSHNPDISEYAPRIMEILTSRLQDAYMQISQLSPADPVLVRIHALVRRAREIKQAAVPEDVYIIKVPPNLSSYVLSASKSLPGEHGAQLQHLRRFAKHPFLPAWLLKSSKATRVKSRSTEKADESQHATIHERKIADNAHVTEIRDDSRDAYILLCPTTSITKEKLLAHLRICVPALFKEPTAYETDENHNEILPIFICPVPLHSPTSQEAASELSRRVWPIVFNPNTTYGPNPADITKAQLTLKDSAGKYMSLSKEVAIECHQLGLGVESGAVVVQRCTINGKGEEHVVCLAGDARYQSQWSITPQSKIPASGEGLCQVGNPAGHAVMRAISIVAAKRRALASPVSTVATASLVPAVNIVFPESPLTPLEQQYNLSTETLTPNGYLCLDLEIYLTHEPCVMCCMALNHSRFGRVVFERRLPRTGGLCADGLYERQSHSYGLFWREELTWRMLAWQWRDDVDLVDDCAEIPGERKITEDIENTHF